MRERLEDLCRIFPLEHLLDREIFKLSSGEKQIVAIASVCAAKPKVLIMDEPTANLDTKTTVLLATMLNNLKEEGTTIIMAEHRLFFAKDLFDRAILMKDGEIEKEFTREEAVGLTDKELRQYGLRLFETPTIGKAMSVTKEWIEYASIDTERVDLRVGDKYPLDSASFHSPYGKVLAIASLTEREVIIFDEPTSGLDGYNMRLIAKRIRQLAAKGKNVVIITHDIELITRAADSVTYMTNGRVTSRLILERDGD